MKLKRAVEAAARWSRGDVKSALAILHRQFVVDRPLGKQFTEEAEVAYVEEKIIPEALERGYSLERKDELIHAIRERLRTGEWQ